MSDIKLDLSNLSDSFKEKAVACETAEAFIKLAASEGIELTDEQVAAISGGALWDEWLGHAVCKSCGSPSVHSTYAGGAAIHTCAACGFIWSD